VEVLLSEVLLDLLSQKKEGGAVQCDAVERIGKTADESGDCRRIGQDDDGLQPMKMFTLDKRSAPPAFCRYQDS
jgi:hypothetical protein